MLKSCAEEQQQHDCRELHPIPDIRVNSRCHEPPWGSKGTGVPPPRVTNSWTADNPAIAGIARICTIRLSCQFGRVNGLIQVLSEPTMTQAGRRNSMNPSKAATCSATRPARCSPRIVQRARSWPGIKAISSPIASPHSHAGPSCSTATSLAGARGRIRAR